MVAFAHQPKDAGIFPVVGDTPELSADHLEPIDTEMHDENDIEAALEELQTYVDKINAEGATEEVRQPASQSVSQSASQSVSQGEGES